jgi:hypothetical protein
MKSSVPGIATSAAEVEVTNISPHGLWLLARGEELYLPFSDFPWFRAARVSEILHVEPCGPGGFRWPSLDVDLSLESIRHPEKYPLVARGPDPASQVHEPTGE